MSEDFKPLVYAQFQTALAALCAGAIELFSLVIEAKKQGFLLWPCKINFASGPEKLHLLFDKMTFDR
jgi:hypothetical protein